MSDIDLFGDPVENVQPVAEQPERWPQRIAEIVDWLLDELKSAQPEQPGADLRRIAFRQAVRLCREVGGQQWYWPLPASLERVVQHARIWAEFDGTTDGPNGIMALSRRYGVSTKHIYNVVASERARHVRSVQSDLFE